MIKQNTVPRPKPQRKRESKARANANDTKITSLTCAVGAQKLVHRTAVQLCQLLVVLPGRLVFAALPFADSALIHVHLFCNVDLPQTGGKPEFSHVGQLFSPPCLSYDFLVKSTRKGGDNLEIELTKDAKRALAKVYQKYKSRRKSGMSKSAASYIDVTAEFPNDFQEILDNCQELNKAGLVSLDYGLGLSITDAAIIYMENKTEKTIKEWLSFASGFIP